MTAEPPHPAPRPAKARLLHDGRDMFWSMAPLVVACILLAGLLGMCSFQPLGPGRGVVPSYDAAAALRADAADIGFPLRLPKLPPGWAANSGSRGTIGPARTATVGYLAPSGRYVSLTQSNADEPQLVGTIHNDMYPTGAQEVNGVHWVVYQGADKTEPVWTTRLDNAAGATHIAITGAGSVGEFRTLAAATQSQPPLPAR
ncbi:MAG: DUF4245 domain-containing protein [Mycobacteriaceae bacterium]|nr:DUF4245 domain-containing protein [Mycobacteriaceae bacterium]